MFGIVDCKVCYLYSYIQTDLNNISWKLKYFLSFSFFSFVLQNSILVQQVFWLVLLLYITTTLKLVLILIYLKVYVFAPVMDAQIVLLNKKCLLKHLLGKRAIIQSKATWDPFNYGSAQM